VWLEIEALVRHTDGDGAITPYGENASFGGGSVVAEVGENHSRATT
jgi:hypothetical protein